MMDERINRLIRLSTDDQIENLLAQVDLRTIKNNKDVYRDYIIQLIREKFEENMTSKIIPQLDDMIDRSYLDIHLHFDIAYTLDPTHIVENAWTLRDDKIGNLLDDE